MKIFILLFFILIILILSAKIEICIIKLQLIDKIIRFNIRINLYVFKKIKIISKKIHKKDIIKLINFSETKRHFKEEKNFLNFLDINISEFNFELNYGLRNVIANSYLFGILNTIIPTILANYTNEKTKIKYRINSNYKKNMINIKIQSLLIIDIFNSIKKFLRSKFQIKKQLIKKY